MITTEEVKTYFEVLIDDTMDETATYQSMQNEQEKLELERDWMVLRKLDTSITVLTTDTWQTAKPLPTNFLSPRKVYVGSDQGEPYEEISMDNILQYKDCTGYYYIDYSDMTIHFTGTHTQTYTVYLFYKKTIGDIEDGTEELPWPGKTGLVLAYRMAEFNKSGVDGDTVNFQMTPGQRAEYKELKNALIQWDTKLQIKSMGN